MWNKALLKTFICPTLTNTEKRWVLHFLQNQLQNNVKSKFHSWTLNVTFTSFFWLTGRETRSVKNCKSNHEVHRLWHRLNSTEFKLTAAFWLRLQLFEAAFLSLFRATSNSLHRLQGPQRPLQKMLWEYLQIRLSKRQVVSARINVILPALRKLKCLHKRTFFEIFISLLFPVHVTWYGLKVVKTFSRCDCGTL